MGGELSNLLLSSGVASSYPAAISKVSCKSKVPSQKLFNRKTNFIILNLLVCSIIHPSYYFFSPLKQKVASYLLVFME